MRTSSIARAVAASLAMLFAGAASAGYYMTRLEAKISGNPDVKVTSHVEPEFVVLANTSDSAVRCDVEFLQGLAPAGSQKVTLRPHTEWLMRSPVAGPVAVIRVNVGCG